jgi:lipopolysaccharide/colanic/teichoic acid biosynthesis glycosyltransferase
MKFRSNTPFLLFVGDIVVFFFSLWLTLILRYQAIPSQNVFIDHFQPFMVLFVLWVAIFFIAGLYDRFVIVVRRELPGLIFRAQLVNSIIAALFFYFISSEIAPKTNLFLNLLVTFIFMSVWRLSLAPIIDPKKKHKALLVGDGECAQALVKSLSETTLYPFWVTRVVAPRDLKSPKDLQVNIAEAEARVVILDIENAQSEVFLGGSVSDLLYKGIQFVNISTLYEQICGRVSLELVRQGWVLTHVRTLSSLIYTVSKRAMDIAVSFVGSVVVFIIAPFVWVANLFEGGGPLFIAQERIGKGNKTIRIIKFRSMLVDDAAHAAQKGTNRDTVVGRFLRKAHIDEYPQFINVLKGDLSLIGPRPELPRFVAEYEQSIPYYSIRHIVQPGLSGWAQLYHKTPPKRDLNVNETCVKLSYDLYYVKNRSFGLDFIIALKTIKSLVSRSGK